MKCIILFGFLFPFDNLVELNCQNGTQELWMYMDEVHRWYEQGSAYTHTFDQSKDNMI